MHDIHSAEFDYEEEEEIEKELEEKCNIVNKIIKCLNDFEEIVEPDPSFRAPLHLSIKDLGIAYDQILLKIRYIKEAILDEKPFEKLYLSIFELLFLNLKKINYENLEEKIDIFNIILNILKGEREEKKEEEFMNKVKLEKKEWKNMIEILSDKFGGFAFIFCIVLIYSKSIEKIVEFYINFLSTIYTCVPKFDYKELQSLSEACIIKDLLAILNGNTNYFYIVIEEGHIKKCNFNQKEIEKIKNEELDFYSSDEDKKNKFFGFKNNIKESIGLKDVSLNFKYKDKKDTKINEKSEEKKMKALFEDVKGIKMELEKLKSKTEKIENYQYHIEKELKEIKFELNFIKSKGALKSFIDFFHFGLGLKDSYNEPYKEKVSEILFELNKFNDSKKYNQIKINKIRALLRNSIEKLTSENSFSYEIDLTEPVLEQLFKIIDADGDKDDIKQSLSTIGANIIILNSIKAKERLLLDQITLEKEENKIYMNLKPEKICSIFKNK